MQAFFKSLPYLAKSKRGFNLFEISEDAKGGVTVQTVADDWFGDPFNHGLRIFSNTDDYMLIGTANPFYGTQLWRVTNTLFPVHVSATDGGTASADYTTDVAPGTKVTLKATPQDGRRFAKWDVTRGDVEVADDGTFEMPQSSVHVQAVFERIDGADTPADNPSDDPSNDPFDDSAGDGSTDGGAAGGTGTGDDANGAGTTGDTTVLSTTGASITAMVIACLTVTMLGAGMLLARKRNA